MKEYERLTKWEIPNCASVNGVLPIDKDMANAINRLAELEDKIENGTLKEIKFPCQVGDKVFVVVSKTSNNKNFYIFEDSVLDLCSSTFEGLGSFYLYIKLSKHLSVCEWNFDKVFLTKAEAEKKLKELQGE